MSCLITVRVHLVLAIVCPFFRCLFINPSHMNVVQVYIGNDIFTNSAGPETGACFTCAEYILHVFSSHVYVN